MKMSAHFDPPQIQDNPDGWGPCALPDQFRDIPYQPFSKGDRLGKVSDWSGATYQDKRSTNKYSSQFGSGGNQYSYFHEEDESTFQLVDTVKVQKPIYQRNRIRVLQQQRNMRRERERREQRNKGTTQATTKVEKERQRQLRRLQKQFGRHRVSDQNRGQTMTRSREASVEVKPSWQVVEEMDFPRLAKLKLPDTPQPQDLVTCGALEYYDKMYDRVNTKMEKRLQRVNRIFHKVTTTDDPVIRKLASKGNVFATDIILATLMCCPRSVYSWDIVVQHVGGKLFFDKRDDSEFDLLTVNETDQYPPQEEGSHINSPHNLALEATFINHNFSQQVLKMSGEKHKFQESNPFAQEEVEGDVASVAYRYRKYQLGNDIELIVRCELDSVLVGSSGETQFVNIKTFNEWDPKASNSPEWRQKLDTQRGAILATELKNNSFKLAKWTACALLAGSDQLKFGYVSRANPKDSSKHVILGTQLFKPVEFASQINLNLDSMWGILRCVIDICRGLPEGKYLVLKDPNKPVVRIYDIPDNTFESEDSDEGDEDDADSQDDED